MKSKNQPDKQPLDIERSKKQPPEGTATAPELVIPKRSILVQEAEVEIPEAEPIKARQVAKDLEPENLQAAAPADRPRPETQPQSTQQAPDEGAEKSTEPARQAEAAQPPAQPEPPQPDPAQEPADTATPPEGNESKSSKAHPHVRKALEDAKRKQEINEYIENKEFFVPIDTLGRKRSLRVTIGLTALELLLGLALLNLMLDAGVIQLLEKIPHTNFFHLQ